MSQPCGLHMSNICIDHRTHCVKQMFSSKVISAKKREKSVVFYKTLFSSRFNLVFWPRKTIRPVLTAVQWLVMMTIIFMIREKVKIILTLERIPKLLIFTFRSVENSFEADLTIWRYRRRQRRCAIFRARRWPEVAN